MELLYIIVSINLVAKSLHSQKVRSQMCSELTLN